MFEGVWAETLRPTVYIVPGICAAVLLLEPVCEALRRACKWCAARAKATADDDDMGV